MIYPYKVGESLHITINDEKLMLATEQMALNKYARQIEHKFFETFQREVQEIKMQKIPPAFYHKQNIKFLAIVK